MYHWNVYLYPPTSASPSQDFLPAVCLSSPLSAIHRHIQAHLSAPCQFLLCLILHRKSSVSFASPPGWLWFEVKAYASTNTVCTILSIVLAVCALVLGIGFLPSLVVCLIWIVNQSVYCKEALKYSKAGTKISWWKRRRTGNGKLFGDYCCADYLFLHQEKKANSSGCVADTKSMYRIFIVEDDEIIARTVKSHLETMSDELRKSTIFH